MPMHAWSIAALLALTLVILSVLAWLVVRLRAPRRMATEQAQDPDPTVPAPIATAIPAPTADDGMSAYRAACAEAQQRLHALAFGTDAPDPGATPSVQEAIAATVRTQLRQIAEQPNYAPRRPMLLPRLIQAMRDDDVSRRELARIIASDPVLAGNLVRLANSPVYRHSEAPIESLDRAVAVLGTEGMRSLTTAALLQPVFRISGRHFAHFGEITWQHTFLSASGAEAHAAVVEDSDPFAAQLLGLIMGLATIVIFRVATDVYMERRRVPVAGTIAGLIDSEIVPVARQIAASWELSDRVDVALADQAAAPHVDWSSLGRSLQFGRFAGALAMLRIRQLIDDEEAGAALRTGGRNSDAFTRIWARLASAQP
jgi:HD-like signal output (HDOD) protein